MAKWINCKECGHEFSSSLSHCPECGKRRLTAKTALGGIFGTAFAVLVVIGMIMGFSDNGKTDTVSKEGSNITSEEKDESASYPLGTVVKNGKAYSTVPKYFLEYLFDVFDVEGEMSFNEFAYSLKDEDKDYGYTDVIKNKDGSATLVLPESKLSDMAAKRLTTSKQYIKETENQEFIKKIEYSEKLDKFEITLNTEELNDEQKANLVIFGIYFLEYQYCMEDGANKCEITVVYPDGISETLYFPNVIE